MRSETPTTLAEAVTNRARELGLTIVTAESCTGGALAALLSKTPGAGDVFLGGFVCYSKAFKEVVLKVRPTLLATDTAVSEKVAQALAEGALTELPADLAIAITGVVGPEPDEDGNPVGMIHIGVSSRSGNFHHASLMLEASSPDHIRNAAMLSALELAIRAMGVPGDK